MNKTRTKQIRRYTLKDTPAPHVKHVARVRRKFYSRATGKQRAELLAEMKYELDSN